jgi:DNA-binding FadR family transcriptional regulator
MSEGLHTSVLDTLGREITAGELAPGSVLTLERLQQRFGISRTVARECMRLLEQLRLVTSGRRVGIVVRPVVDWDVLDPLVIRWRLAGPGRPAQLRSLIELRAAVEPLAASSAALHASDDQRAEIVATVERMRAAREAGLRDDYLALDIEFHTNLLRASRNEMFAALTDVVAAVLAGRTAAGLAPRETSNATLDGHDAVAHAVLAGDGAEAERNMRGIMSAARESIRAVDGF